MKFLVLLYSVLLLPCFKLYAEDVFTPVASGYVFSFPKDLGAHYNYQTEWWYFTGHLEDDAAHTYGIEITFFRIGIPNATSTASAWSPHSLYIVHFAVTDDEGKKFYYKEFLNRGAFGEAGASPDSLDVWLGDFRAQLKNAAIELTAASEDYKVKLNVKSIKSPVLQGDSGISVKGKQPGEASLYISLTRLLGDGELEIAGKKRSIVHASLWLDHEVMSTQVTSTSKGWDWFGIQLQDGREIMVYNLRENSVKTEFSYGSVIEKDGRIHKLRGSDFNIDVLDDWTSPLTGKRYPSRFRLTIPSISESFEIIPTVAQQELVTNRTTNVTYWEGRATVEKAGERAGNAYVELVGY